jgi:hypothetical protein
MIIDLFTFVINGTEIAHNLDQALALPPTIHAQLSADCSFIIEAEDVDAPHFETV